MSKSSCIMSAWLFNEPTFNESSHTIRQTALESILFKKSTCVCVCVCVTHSLKSAAHIHTKKGWGMGQ